MLLLLPLPSGSRRRPFSLVAGLALLLLLTSTARAAAVLGIDLGTLNIKAALVKPGIPLDIVLTKDSKRKETAALAFKPNRDDGTTNNNHIAIFPERAYGSDALALQGRFPADVFPNLKQLLARSAQDAHHQATSTYNARYPAVNVQHVQEQGTTVIKSSAFAEHSLPYSVEELIGMQLANIKRNAEAMAGPGSSIDDAVITIPAFYTADEKRAIIHAAYFAGLNVLGLTSDGLAVGLDYAKTRNFPDVTKGEAPEYHMVFDMGAGSTTATVMRFQSRSVKDVGRFNKTVQEVAVQGVGWDRTLGGDALTHVVMDDLVEKLLAKTEVKSSEHEIRSNGRIMSRFWKEAERARQVLSANTETSAGFEEILPDVDLRVKLSRAEFEKLTADYAARVDKPIEEALRMAKLSIKDVKSVILHGGAIRTPFVHSKLEAAVDDKAKLRSNVNPDESAVFGAAFKAAALSPSFKVKEIRDSDVAVYPTSLVYTDKGKERKQLLFGPSSPSGSGATIKQVTFKDKEDFAFGFNQKVGDQERPILKVETANLTASVEHLKSKFGCERDAMTTKFSVKLGGAHSLPEVTGGSVSCEVDDSVKSGSVGDSVKGWLGLGKKKDQEPLGECGDDSPVEEVEASVSPSISSTASTGTVSSDSASATPKKHTEIVPLKFSMAPDGIHQPDAAQLAQITDRLREFDTSDRARVLREEALNALESYTYSVRDFLENADYESVSTKDARDAIAKTLQTTKEWMESSEFATATREVLKEKLDDLKKLVDPIKARKTESAQRPVLVTGLQKSLDEAKASIAKISAQVEKAKASLTASSSESSTTATETAASSADADDLEDLQKSSTTKAAPKSTDDSSALANLDLTSITSTYEEISKWLEDKLAEQSKLKPFEDPTLLAKDIERKSTELGSALQEIVRKAAAKPSKKPAPRPKTSKTKSNRKSSTKTEAEGKEATNMPEDRKPVTGEESIDDLLKRMSEDQAEKPGAPIRDEL